MFNTFSYFSITTCIIQKKQTSNKLPIQNMYLYQSLISYHLHYTRYIYVTFIINPELDICIYNNQ